MSQTNVFTLIAYKENGVESHRSCVTDRWDSDIQMHTTRDFEEAAAWLADKRVKNHKAQQAPDGIYAFTVLVNGLGQEWLPDEDSVLAKEREDLIGALHTRAQDLAQITIAAHEAQKVRQAAERLAAAERAKKVAELQALRGKLDAGAIAENRARLAALEAELT